ncbi:MAG: hypothetical protein K2K93_00730, partial [Muribaculaceae bacterium]|nr:hypothetical protein [Muribaculaceae bacterium]
ADAIDAVDEYYPECARFAGVEAIGGNGSVVAVEYYDLRGVRIPAPADGISIRRIVMSDGSVQTDKVIKK